MTLSEREQSFHRIKAYFESKDREYARKGKLPLGSTEKGFWGTAHLDDVYAFFTQIDLSSESSFLDLGSGDGRVVFVAALFTEATGIEFDEKLHAEALAAQAALHIPRAHFFCEDYTLRDLSPYAVWFTYADHNFEWLRAKERELTTLYLYHDTFHPHFLTKGKITWIGQIPIFRYTQSSTD